LFIKVPGCFVYLFSINLIGFDFNGEIGKYSFPRGKDKNLKLQKLKWCRNLIDLLKKDKQNIQEL
jgi:uncharacterized Rossmann fold enzyme